MVKLLPSDLEVTGSNHGNSLLQNRIKLRIIDPSLVSYIGGSFVHWTALIVSIYWTDSLLFACLIGILV